ncbi:hypothetical protein AGLY_015978 [Aphis glycines]|uniref:Uncharacterized protein n=1 Tax=Aphis glycines TaxID=307491 RepID=A0A6G0SYH0_APHGL|nr:hypothetical protein AGLY_015978 [Aphis glycines]
MGPSPDLFILLTNSYNLHLDIDFPRSQSLDSRPQEIEKLLYCIQQCYRFFHISLQVATHTIFLITPILIEPLNHSPGKRDEDYSRQWIVIFLARAFKLNIHRPPTKSKINPCKANLTTFLESALCRSCRETYMTSGDTNSERSDECIDFTKIITSRNNAPISNYGGGFRCKSEYPWCIIETRGK